MRRWQVVLGLMLAAGPICSLPAQPASTAASARWPAVTWPDPDQAERREILVSHGITPLPESMRRFLREGFPAGNRSLPAEPRLKLAVVDAVVQELALTGVRDALPELLEIAERRGPSGVTAILMRDFEDLPIDAVDQQLNLARRALSLNTVTALGILGDPGAEETILRLMRSESATGFVTKGAEALGLLNSSAGLPAVVLLASNPQGLDGVAAFRTIFTLTGRNYGVTEFTSVARRRQLIEQLNDWYRREGTNVVVVRGEVERRLFNPPAPPELDPSSLRGILRASTDLNSFDRRLSARQQLAADANNRFDELRAIAEDPMEDLDIRRAALRWMAMADARASRPTIRRAKRDENPIIVEMAGSVERDLPSYEAQQKRQRR